MKGKLADRYQIEKKCGEGAYGKVYLATDLKNNSSVAIKKIKLASVEEGVPISSIREISLLKELNHKNIVQLRDIIHLENKIILVFEYVNQDLKQLLKSYSGQGLETKLYKSLLYQLLVGIQYVHKLKILHRDLKSENLLVSKDGVLKIADFGLARGFGLPIKTFRNDVVSLWYRSPDILLGNENYTVSVDMWSVGCIFAEMVNGSILFQAYSEKEQIKKKKPRKMQNYSEIYKVRMSSYKQSKRQNEESHHSRYLNRSMEINNLDITDNKQHEFYVPKIDSSITNRINNQQSNISYRERQYRPHNQSSIN